MAVASIRFRILKGDRAEPKVVVLQGGSGVDPLQDSESRAWLVAYLYSRCGSGVDSLQDSERLLPFPSAKVFAQLIVAVASIRFRILKVLSIHGQRKNGQVAVASIRYRILKEVGPRLFQLDNERGRGIDPFRDNAMEKWDDILGNGQGQWRGIIMRLLRYL